MSKRNPTKHEQMMTTLKALAEPHNYINEVWKYCEQPPYILVTRTDERRVRLYVVYALLDAGYIECSREYLTGGGFDQVDPIEHYEYTITPAGRTALAAEAPER